MATLYLRDGQYYINYTVNGKRVRRSVGGDRREADLIVKELSYKLSRGDIRVDRPEIPLDHFFKMYLENCKERLTEGTY